MARRSSSMRTHGCQTPHVRPHRLLHAADAPARQLGRLVLGRQAHLGHGPGRAEGDCSTTCYHGHGRKRRLRCCSGDATSRRRPGDGAGCLPSRCCFWLTEHRREADIHLPRRELRRRPCHADKWIPVLPNTDVGAAAGHRLRVDHRRHCTTRSTWTRTPSGFDWTSVYYVHGRRGRRRRRRPSGPRPSAACRRCTIKALAPPLGEARRVHRALQRRLVHPLQLRARAGASGSGASGHAGRGQAGRATSSSSSSGRSTA